MFEPSSRYRGSYNDEVSNEPCPTVKFVDRSGRLGITRRVRRRSCSTMGLFKNKKTVHAGSSERS